MMPFASEILKNRVCWSIIDDTDSAYSLIKIDFQKWENHLPPESVKLPTATKTLLSSLQASLTKEVSIKENMLQLLKVLLKSYRKACHWNTFLFDLCLVLFQRIWLKVNIVLKLYTVNQINSKKADNAKLQLEEFQSQVAVSSAAKIHKDKFLGFSHAKIIWIIFATGI